MSHAYPRETVENVPFDTVTFNGVTYTNYTYALTPVSQRPTTWKTPTVAGGVNVFRLDGTLPRGDYRVWVKVTTADGQTPVIEGPIISIT